MGTDSRLARERAVRCGAMAFAPQRFQSGARTPCRWVFSRANSAFGVVAGRLLAGSCLAVPWWRQFYSSSAGFGQPDGDGLFGGAGSVFAFTDVMDFFTDELSGLR